MSLILLLTLAIVGVPVLLVLLVTIALWARTARARRRAETSTFTEPAETIQQRNADLAPTNQFPPVPPRAGSGPDPDAQR